MAAAGGRASRSLKKAVVKHPAYASWGSVVNAQVKAKLIPSSKCNLGKFLGIRDPPASDVSLLITKFMKLNNRQNPGMKKDALSEEKLRSMLEGKERVGVSEIAKLLAQQFPKRLKPSTLRDSISDRLAFNLQGWGWVSSYNGLERILLVLMLCLWSCHLVAESQEWKSCTQGKEQKAPSERSYYPPKYSCNKDRLMLVDSIILSWESFDTCLIDLSRPHLSIVWTVHFIWCLLVMQNLQVLSRVRTSLFLKEFAGFICCSFLLFPPV